MLTRILRQLWRDDDGSVIAAEYLMLAGVVVLGGFSGVAAVRDATVNEGQETAQSIKTLNQSYRTPTSSSAAATAGGAYVIDKGGSTGTSATTVITP